MTSSHHLMSPPQITYSFHLLLKSPPHFVSSSNHLLKSPPHFVSSSNHLLKSPSHFVSSSNHLLISFPSNHHPMSALLISNQTSNSFHLSRPPQTTSSYHPSPSMH